MNTAETAAAILGSGAVTAVIGWLAGRGRQRADAAGVIASAAAQVTETLRVELDRLADDLTEARAAAERAEREASALRVELSATRAAAERAEQEAGRLRAELAAARAEIGRLRAELAAALHTTE